MLARINQRIGRAALRAAVIGLATAATCSGFAATASAATPSGARDLDWSNATLQLIESDGWCPGGPVKFSGGYAEVDLGEDRTSPYFQGAVKFGDVNRDGREDAVLSVECWPVGNSRVPATTLYAFGVKNGAPTPIGTVTTPIVQLDSYDVRRDTVTVRARPDRDPESSALTFKLRWNGTSFTERTGKAAYLYNWGSEQLALPFKADAVPMSDGMGGKTRPCPKATIDFDDHRSYGRFGEFVSSDNFTYAINAGHFGDVNRDGVTDVIVTIHCSDREVWNGPDSWNYVYTVKNGKPVLLSYLTASNSVAGYTGVHSLTLSRGRISLGQYAGTSDVSHDRTFRWSRHGLRADAPLPGFPTVDVAP